MVLGQKTHQHVGQRDG